MNRLIGLYRQGMSRMDQYVEWAAMPTTSAKWVGWVVGRKRQAAAVWPLALATALYLIFLAFADVRILPSWITRLGMAVAIIAMIPAGYVALRITIEEVFEGLRGKPK